MDSVIKNNSYNILGIDTSASQKEILKRSKDLINLLKIDSVPDFDEQINVFDESLNEDMVREAAQKLANPRKKIMDYFFWFQIQDSEDGNAFSLVKKEKYRDAIDSWKDAEKKNKSRIFFYKKNLAILYLLLLSLKSNKSYIKSSIQIWKELLNSEVFWSNFKKIYKLHDEGQTSQEVINDFQNNIINSLADIYADLGHQYKDSSYVKEFSQHFSSKGGKIEKEFLNPIYQKINDVVKELESMNISEDGVFDSSERAKVKQLIVDFQEELNKLIELGLYEESHSKEMRDRAASALRKISLDVHNNLHDLDASMGLTKIANQISGTTIVKDTLDEDMRILKENKSFKEREKKMGELMEPLTRYIKNGDANNFFLVINNYLNDSSIDGDIKEALLKIKQDYEDRIRIHGKPVKNAPSLHTINGIGSKLYGDTLYAVILFIPIFPMARYSVSAAPGGGYYFHGQLKLHDWQKYWQYTVYAIAGISLAFIIGSILAS